MKILITGVTGMLGSKIAASLVVNPSYKIFGFARTKTTEINNAGYVYLDLIDKDELKARVNQISPDVIIHCAANVNIGDCENNKEKTFALHVEASETLALCNVNTRIIYISTDSVYNGIQGNYSESDPTDPINYYAQTKLLGEQAVLKNSLNALVIRTNIYGFSNPMKSSLAEWAITRLMSADEKINGFDDVFFNPLYVGQLADCMHGIMDSKINGIINFGTTEQISKYDFLIKIAEVFNFDKELIIENSISNFEALKNRPRNTTLNTGYLDKKLDLSFSIDDGIHLMYQDYKRIFNEQN